MLRDLLGGIGFAALRAGLRFPDIPLIMRFSEQGHLIDLLNSLKINYVLDVGANKGWFAKRLRLAGYQGHLLCFEPLRADCDAISRLAAGDPSWQIFNFALGAENTTKPFNAISVADGGTTLSSFLQPKGKVNLVMGTESVAMRRIDDVWMKSSRMLLRLVYFRKWTLKAMIWKS